ncbi:MAG: Gfo/Idh/MocA family oxidoreductase, partial [Clostridia bacterium]|nr:Gfo/Idh/MocA family oxidoreductase [Clostridia bacterium]
MKKIKLGCIGMGQRGILMLETILKLCDNTEVKAVCDLYEDRAQEAFDMVKKEKGYEPFKTTCPHEVIQREDVDAVLIFAAWESHVDLAIEAM